VIRRRLFPLLATAGLIVTGMIVTTWTGPALTGHPDWLLPNDLWSTMIAAQRLLHGDLAGIYALPSRLVSFPGAAIILLPLAAVADAAGLSLQLQAAHDPQPALWLLAGPYEIALSGLALFAADALAGHLGAGRPRRALLAAAGAIALWNVSVLWGHPEDAVAVGLLLYGVLALARSRPGRAGWLAGAAVAVQPLVLLALPVLVMAAPRRAGFLARAALPSLVLVATAALANRAATFAAVARQPNWPRVDHPTPWTSLAPHLAHGAVAAGPGRLVAIAAACGCALLAGRRWRAAGTWRPEVVEDMLWWAALGLALRALFEPVMVAFYLWPPLAVALVAAARRWTRLAATGVAAGVITFAAQQSWPGPWLWWGVMAAGLAAALCCARLPLSQDQRPGRPGQRPRTPADAPAA
jgi:hypothetical protein